MVLEEFELLKGSPSDGLFQQREDCGKSLPTERLARNDTPIRFKWRIETESKSVYLCFKDISDTKQDIQKQYSLEYTVDEWLAPTPTPNATLESKGEVSTPWKEDGRSRKYYFALE